MSIFRKAKSGFYRRQKPSSATRSAIRTCILAQSTGAVLVQVLINGGLLPLFILHLGGTKFEVGAAFTAHFFSQLIRVPVARYVDVRRLKHMVVLWFLVGAVVFAGVFAAVPVADLAGSRAAVWLVITVFFFQRLTVNIGAAAWHPLLCDIVPSRLRGRFFGRMRATFQTVSLTIVLLTGLYLGKTPQTHHYVGILGLLLIMNLMRPFLLLRLPNPPPARPGAPEPILQNMKHPVLDAGFRRFLLFWGLVAFVINVARPFVVPFLKTDLHFPSSVTVYASGGMVAGMVLTLMAWGRLADHAGNRLVFLLNLLLLAASFILLAVTPGFAGLPAMALVSAALSLILIGTAIGGLGIAHTVRRMHEAPVAHRGPYMNLFMTFNGVIAGLGSMAGGFLLDRLPETLPLGGTETLTLRVFFFVAALLLVATSLMLRGLKPIAERPIRETVLLLTENFLSVLPTPIQSAAAPRRRGTPRRKP